MNHRNQHILFTYTVNKCSESTSLANFRCFCENARVTPIYFNVSTYLHLVETNLVNIMLQIFLVNESVMVVSNALLLLTLLLLAISYGLLLLVPMLSVMCYVLLGVMSNLITNIYVTITHSALMCNALSITDRYRQQIVF